MATVKEIDRRSFGEMLAACAVSIGLPVKIQQRQPEDREFLCPYADSLAMAMSATGLPAMGDAHPGNGAIRCVELIASPTLNKMWKVKAVYGPAR